MTISITNAAEQLRALTGASVSSLDGGHPVVFHPDAKGAIEPVLAQFLNLNEHVRNICVDSRFVIFPIEESAILRAEVNGVMINCMSRIEAAAAYFEYLRETTSGAVNFDLIMAGKLNVPMYDDSVSLSLRATLVEHLIELLGTDREVAFSSLKYANGHWHFWFSRHVE